MAICQVNGNFAIVRLELALSEIPHLLRRHAEENPGTKDLEDTGRALVACGFEPKASNAFVKGVCEWGGGFRFVDRVLEYNTDQAIAAALRRGHASALEGRVAEGVERIDRLHYLGQSFASKHLRFIAPTLSVILDGVLRTRLGYQQTTKGYSEFLEDCQVLLAHAQRSDQLEAKFRATLRVSDIEAALFSKLQGY